MFDNQHIAILGRGMEWQSTYRFLQKEGIPDSSIAIFDQHTDKDFPAWVTTFTGPGYLTHLQDYDVIMRSPGITDVLLQNELQDTALWEIIAPRLTNQTQLFLDRFQGTVIGITGTKGKSTISMLTYLLLQAAGKNVVLAWNVGQPVLEQIDFASPPDYVVYELSSFMLAGLQRAKIHIGIWNTIYPTHLAEHGSRQEYVLAKAHLFSFADTLLLGSQVEDVLQEQFPELLQNRETQVITYGDSGSFSYVDGQFLHDNQLLAGWETVRLVGAHNRYNVCALYGVAHILGITTDLVQKVTQEFVGLPDRIEFIGNICGIDRYNDAIATTPQATQAALAALGDRVATLFVGGILWEYDFSGLAETISHSTIEHLICFPDSGPLIAQLVKKPGLQIYTTASMRDAVKFAASHTPIWKIALLSCGSPSFSLWKSYKEKAAQFKEAVASLA